MYTTKFEGITFIEGRPPEARVLQHVEIKLRGFLSQAQLKTLDDVKRALAKKVREKNGNSLINFKYGQKSSFWNSLVNTDDVMWFGSGDIAVIPHPSVSERA